ncbi:MAG TPA: DUF427 domain-containing protein [Thermomicrobiales bacterium]|nr:DUF427 domain-containing protein [Thermomicrobiales bacterium]
MQHLPSDTPTQQRESTRDYPAHPVVVPDDRHIVVQFNGEVIADTRQARCVLQRGFPPAFYIPPEDVRVEWLVSNQRQTWCGYKGDAHYYDVVVGDRISNDAAWCYPEPLEGFQEIQYAIAFYANRVDSCTVDGEPVEGDDTGGWTTTEIADCGGAS